MKCFDDGREVEFEDCKKCEWVVCTHCGGCMLETQTKEELRRSDGYE